MKIPRRFFLSCLFSVSSLGMVHATQPDFGPNVLIFDPSMPASEIQAALNQVLQQQVSNQFGSQRYAFLFKPGQYSVDAQLGYYTSVAGLGLSPEHMTRRIRHPGHTTASMGSRPTKWPRMSGPTKVGDWAPTASSTSTRAS